MSKIIVVGSSNTDMVIKTNHIPIPGETVLGGNFFMNSGGKGANQAVAIARLGGDVTFITKIGRDVFGKESLKKFKEEGINIDFTVTHKSKPSGIALVTLGDNAENSIVVAPGANNSLKKKNINKAIDEIKKAEIILIQLEIPLKIVKHVIELGRKYGKKVILNPAPGKKLEDVLYRNLFAVTPNETEAEIMTDVKVVDEQSAKKAALVLRSKGVKNVIITLGSKGAYLCSDEFSGIISGYQVIAKDTTAAGDTFNGAFAIGISKGLSIKETIKFANKAASLAVTKLGAQSSIPYLEDLEVHKNYKSEQKTIV
ncbi:ribokinase [Polaribacter cellanae]|uniref:Ribokinase n=1 Tax=Polaribacter cellanae TaxID=2818493 RepID=A0A975CQF9_9FLAO|nr:ribokinase [Polaribacter cellanae]QTE22835.1 ribokinase [Polaribacter cellanae]